MTARETVGHISATEYARLREAEATVARVEALLADHEAGLIPGGKVWISGYTLRRALVGGAS